MRLCISYRTGDLQVVNQIADALRPHAGIAGDGVHFDDYEEFFAGEGE